MSRPRNFDDEVVLARAMETFWTYGYANTSPARLAEATGIAKGSLYNAFSSKRELFNRCLELYHRQVSEFAQAVMDHPGTTKECLRDALRSVVDSDLSQPHRRGCLIGKTAFEMTGQDAAMARTIRRMQDESTGWFAARIAQGKRDGDVSAEIDPQAYADHLATTLAGLRVMAMTHEAPVLYRIIDTALSGL